MKPSTTQGGGIRAQMKPLSTMRGGGVRAVFTDIDDTLTTDGLLTAPAFSAMWALHNANIAVIPVTGRPAGWCDHFARMWPVEGVIGENGAFYFRYDREKKKFVRRFILKDGVSSPFSTLKSCAIIAIFFTLSKLASSALTASTSFQTTSCTYLFFHNSFSKGLPCCAAQALTTSSCNVTSATQ